MPACRATTTQRGLGWRHRQAVAQLHARHKDGTLCWWCDQPMYLDAKKNHDERVLEGDHTIPRSVDKWSLADRLLHGKCNSERGDGSRDHLRPALTGQEVTPAGHGDRQQWCLLSW